MGPDEGDRTIVGSVTVNGVLALSPKRSERVIE
jgi:hypothetical protein